MIVDASAILAIIREEPEGESFARALDEAPNARISAATYVEAAIVIDRDMNPVVSGRFDDFIRSSGLRLEPLSEEQAHLARQAYRNFGRGSGHAANLNFGDCFAYALAKHQDEPLLFKGDDFIHTDIKPALGP